MITVEKETEADNKLEVRQMEGLIDYKEKSLSEESNKIVK